VLPAVQARDGLPLRQVRRLRAEQQQAACLQEPMAELPVCQFVQRDESPPARSPVLQALRQQAHPQPLELAAWEQF
jgi:hypothetical protein